MLVYFQEEIYILFVVNEDLLGITNWLIKQRNEVLWAYILTCDILQWNKNFDL